MTTVEEILLTEEAETLYPTITITRKALEDIKGYLDTVKEHLEESFRLEEMPDGTIDLDAHITMLDDILNT